MAGIGATGREIAIRGFAAAPSWRIAPRRKFSFRHDKHRAADVQSPQLASYLRIETGRFARSSRWQPACKTRPVPTYRLHDTTGDDLGLIEHPAPNVEPGDEVILPDGREALVTARVEAEPGLLAALLQIVIVPSRREADDALP